ARGAAQGVGPNSQSHTGKGRVMAAGRPDSPPLPRLLYSAAEARQMLGIGEKTFRDLIHSGKLKYVRIARTKKFREADLLTFIEGATTWPSSGGRTGPAPGHTGTTSRCRVIGFEEAVKRTTSKPQRS